MQAQGQSRSVLSSGRVLSSDVTAIAFDRTGAGTLVTLSNAKSKTLLR
ncbi:MAG TPA: hypothetical protein VFB89_00265 [Gemmatimonadales bacterium]|nr:hypothetical protein [Gemmatimonadales bacterium]